MPAEAQREISQDCAALSAGAGRPRRSLPRRPRRLNAAGEFADKREMSRGYEEVEGAAVRLEWRCFVSRRKVYCLDGYCLCAGEKNGVMRRIM